MDNRRISKKQEMTLNLKSGVDMNVLVTGGAGYIGSVLVRHLMNQGYRVRVLDWLMYGGSSLFPLLDHPYFEFVFGDLRSQHIVKTSLNDMDAVVHLAAISGDPASKKFPEQTHSINYEASLSLIDLAEKKGLKNLFLLPPAVIMERWKTRMILLMKMLR